MSHRALAQSANAPDRAWASNITSAPTEEVWLRLAVVLDLFSRRVIGWAMDPCIGRHQVLSALDMALEGRVHHADRGGQYARGLRRTMSLQVNCWDNAVVESFVSTLKTELVHERDFPTRESAKAALLEFITQASALGMPHLAVGIITWFHTHLPR
ncbi:DDE-type integrase/transposase/recombinase [Myxococcus dinghuensis]|uniref:DDE-type integrase/transposase/recombinase n=1 Tax=Myxococcus dinghuensis TaxID=2906761 RepID=UPI0038991F73